MVSTFKSKISLNTCPPAHKNRGINIPAIPALFSTTPSPAITTPMNPDVKGMVMLNILMNSSAPHNLVWRNFVRTVCRFTAYIHLPPLHSYNGEQTLQEIPCPVQSPVQYLPQNRDCARESAHQPCGDLPILHVLPIHPLQG